MNRLRPIPLTCKFIFLAVLMAAFSNVSLGAPQEEKAVTNNVVTTIKFPPLKTLSDKLMGVARQVQPGPQTEMMPMFVLGSFGYPAFAGVSPDEGVTVFVFQGETMDEWPFVILAKMEPESQMSAAITQAKWVTKVEGDWTLISQNEAYFGAVKDLDALIALAIAPSDFDIQVEVALGKEKVDAWSNVLKGIVQSGVAAQMNPALGAVKPASVESGVDFFTLMLGNIETSKMGLNLSSESVELGASMKAVEGSAEAALFSMPLSESVPAGDFLENQSSMLFLSRMHSESIDAYVKILEQRLEGTLGEEQEKAIEMLNVWRKGLKHFSGSGAAVSDMNGLLPQATALYACTISDDEIVSLMDELANTFSSFLTENVTTQSYQLSNESKVASHKGVNIHRSLATFTVPDQQTGSEKSIESETFYALVKETLITSNDLEKTKQLIERLQAGASVENNINEAISLKEGVAFQVNLDMANYFKQSLAMLSEELDSQSFQLVLNELSQVEIEPLVSTVTFKDNEAKALTRVTVDAIAKISQISQKANQAKAEQAIIEEQSVTK